MPTVFAVCSALTVVLSGCMVLVYRTGRTYPGFLAWTLGSLALGLAFTLFAYPALFHPLVLTLLGNVLFVAFPILYHQGVRGFAGRRARLAAPILALVGAGVAGYFFSVNYPQVLWRVVTVSFCFFPFVFHSIWIVWRDPAFRYPVVRLWLGGAFLVLLGWTSLRIGLMCVYEPTRQDVWTPSLIQAVTMVVVTAVGIALALGVVVLNFQRASATLREQERRLSLAVGATQEAIWEKNLESGQTHFSPRWFEMLGLAAAAGEGPSEPWQSLYHPDDRESTLARIGEAIAAPESRPFRVEFRMRHADGSWRWIQSRGQVTQRDGQGQPIMVSGANTDITDQVHSREQQSRLEAQLHQAQKMEALGTLAGGIAHDFNNILTGIMGNLQLAALDLPGSSPAAPFLENAEQASRRARDLVARIMTFSRRSEPTRQAIELGPIVEEVAALLRASQPASLVLETRVAPGCPAVNGDAAQIHEMLMNLAVNAAAAIGPRPGRIQLALGYAAPTSEQRAGSPQLGDEPQVQLSVEDDGSGMSPEVAARIFEPFFTTKSPDKGSGLGLTMVHRIVSDLGGTIAVQTTPDRGTRMTIFLPPASAAAVAANRAGPPAAPPPALPPGKRILVVDDDPLVLRVATITLRRLGLEAQAFERPGEGLAAFRGQPRGYAAILTDLTMPEMSGLELAREVRRLHGTVPIIVMTGHLTEESRAAATSLAHLYFLQKPYELAQLQQILAAALPPMRAE